MTPPAICSIISKNRLAKARVLAESFREHHPQGKCHLLIIDSFEGFFDPAKEDFEVLGLEDCAFPAGAGRLFKYNGLELACAAKPFLLRALLEKHGYDKLLYLDSDILITAPLDDLFDRLDENPVLLTPHLDQDFPQDGRLPDDSAILKSGIFNGGFLGIRRCEEAEQFLRWFAGKLRDHSVIDHGRGYFVDQRFLDLAVALFPWIGIERDPGCNVAYWNLHSRRLEKEGAAWRCNGRALRFFHFSDYSPEKPDLISGFQNRFSFASRPDLVPLFEEYGRRLIARGHDSTSAWPYGHGVYANGQAITYTARQAYQRHEDVLQLLGDPFRLPLLEFLSRLLVGSPFLQHHQARLKRSGTNALLWLLSKAPLPAKQPSVECRD